MKPRVSIIMGIYNCEPTLKEAVESILDQTFQDWKMIMCDDGSTDQTYQLAESYVKQYPEKFILIRNEHNMGLNYTLNHCLKYADTEYIARMDGDDISLPTRLEAVKNGDTALFVAPQSADSLCNAMQSIVELDYCRMGVSAVTFAIENFDSKVLCEKILERKKMLLGED